METELLAIFDESHNQVGSASRAEVHSQVGKDNFVPHEKAYFESVIHSITQYLSETKD
ncbi:hypothetical protein P4V47_09805 [Brevibacillus laterosporus]|uniref:hypothetical protein n=1 Tax=Brevibacillus laterosporus TaxID=1465 RepID=UPI002E1CED79|nr:hypothetical protein [Brevibacillus laterosporus]